MEISLEKRLHPVEPFHLDVQELQADYDKYAEKYDKYFLTPENLKEKYPYVTIYSNVENPIIGMGVLVGPYHIITACHNFIDEDSKKSDPSINIAIGQVVIGLKFIFNPRSIGSLIAKQSSEYKTVNIQKVIYYRDYLYNYIDNFEESIKSDMALIIVDQPIGFQYGFIKIGMEFEKKLMNQNEVDLILPSYMKSSNKTKLDIKSYGEAIISTDEFFLNYQFQTKKGQSGSPVLMSILNEKILLIGVHTRGTPTHSSALKLMSCFVFYLLKTDELIQRYNFDFSQDFSRILDQIEESIHQNEIKYIGEDHFLDLNQNSHQTLVISTRERSFYTITENKGGLKSSRSEFYLSATSETQSYKSGHKQAQIEYEYSNNLNSFESQENDNEKKTNSKYHQVGFQAVPKNQDSNESLYFLTSTDEKQDYPALNINADDIDLQKLTTNFIEGGDAKLEKIDQNRFVNDDSYDNEHIIEKDISHIKVLPGFMKLKNPKQTVELNQKDSSIEEPAFLILE